MIYSVFDLIKMLQLKLLKKRQVFRKQISEIVRTKTAFISFSSRKWRSFWINDGAHAIFSICESTHLSIRGCIMCANSILCTCAVLGLLPFYHRETAHVRSWEQSINHLTSLHHDDAAGRYKGRITFKTFWAKTPFFSQQWVNSVHILNYAFENRKSLRISTLFS